MLDVAAYLERGLVGSAVDRWFVGPVPGFTLAPGFGAQGATAADLTGRFGAVAHNVLASESRSILAAGPDAIAETIRTRNARYQEVLRG